MKSSKHQFIVWALVLIVVWVVLRVALAITSVALHLLWIAAIVSVVLWVWKNLSGRGSPAA